MKLEEFMGGRKAMCVPIHNELYLRTSTWYRASCKSSLIAYHVGITDARLYFADPFIRLSAVRLEDGIVTLAISPVKVELTS